MSSSCGDHFPSCSVSPSVSTALPLSSSVSTTSARMSGILTFTPPISPRCACQLPRNSLSGYCAALQPVSKSSRKSAATIFRIGRTSVSKRCNLLEYTPFAAALPSFLPILLIKQQKIRESYALPRILSFLIKGSPSKLPRSRRLRSSNRRRDRSSLPGCRCNTRRLADYLSR